VDGQRNRRTGWLTITHIYVMGVVVLAVLTAILIAQRAKILHLGREVVQLEARRSDLRENCRKLNSQMESLRSVSSLQQSLQKLDIDLAPRPVSAESASRDAHSANSEAAE